MKYRIVADTWLGFEAQFRWSWFPFWMQCYGSNTSSTLAGAEDILRRHFRGLTRNGKPKPGTVVMTYPPNVLPC